MQCVYSSLLTYVTLSLPLLGVGVHSMVLRLRIHGSHTTLVLKRGALGGKRSRSRLRNAHGRDHGSLREGGWNLGAIVGVLIVRRRG